MSRHETYEDMHLAYFGCTPPAAQPDPNESRIRAINDISQYAALSEEDCERLGIEF